MRRNSLIPCLLVALLSVLMGQDCTDSTGVSPVLDPTKPTPNPESPGTLPKPKAPPAPPRPLEALATEQSIPLTASLAKFAVIQRGVAGNFRLDNELLLITNASGQDYSETVTWVWFDTNCLAGGFDQVQLVLAGIDSFEATGAINLDRLVDNPWVQNDLALSLPRFDNQRWVEAPWGDRWYAIDITYLCLQWRQGKYPNYGLQLRPFIEDTSDYFYGPDCKKVEWRPYLWVSRPSQTVSHFKFPLPGRRASVVTVPGGHFGDGPQNDQYCTQAGMTDVPLLHTGVDWATGEFGVPVCAIERGVVKCARDDAKQGGYIVIEHGEGTDRFTSIYTHTSPTVSVGQEIARGKPIGTLASGTAGYGAHLHFGLRWGAFDERWSIIGRLPQQACTTAYTPDAPEPEFPDKFCNPEDIAVWDD